MISLIVTNSSITDSDNKLIAVYEFNIYCKFNYIVGETATGKSLFIENMDLAKKKTAGWRYNCGGTEVLLARDSELLLKMLVADRTSKNRLIIMDEEVIADIRKQKKLSILENSKDYYLIVDRNNINCGETNVNAIFEFRRQIINVRGRKKSIYKTVPSFGLNSRNNEINPDEYRYFVTEDTASGEIFWKNIFKTLEVVECNPPGNSGVLDTILRIIETKDRGKILVALDYDAGSTCMGNIVLCHKNSVNLSRVTFIPLECFEEVICNSEFILSKFPEMRDEVINYKDYIDATYQHTGKYFSYLLFKYVKVKSPLKVSGGRNVTKFYSKGMKNFKQCFIDKCCAYNNNECKLYYNGDKRRALLSNKFEACQIFLDNFDK